MISWVMYDIQSNKARTKVAKYCKQAGLHRVQYSVFLGTLNKNQKDNLELLTAELINPDIDKVYIFQMSRQELKQTVLLGQAFDKKIITNQVKALFF